LLVLTVIKSKGLKQASLKRNNQQYSSLISVLTYYAKHEAKN